MGRATRQPAKPTGKRQWARMGERKYVAEQLKQLHDDIDGARDDRSWQALAALYRQAMSMRERLDAIDRASAVKEDADARLTGEQLVDAIIDEMERLPPGALERIADRVELLLSPPSEEPE